MEINNNLISIDKIISTVDINDDFYDSCVIFVLDRNVSEINKNHDDTICNDIKCSKITDLIYHHLIKLIAHILVL